MSTYVAVRDVMDAVRRFHRQRQVVYARLAEQSDRRRVQILLDYMSRRELRFQEGLAEQQEEGKATISKVGSAVARDA